jgi:hypothetical protein
VPLPARKVSALLCLLFAAVSALFAAEARASDLEIPREARAAIDLMYSGKTEQAVALAHKLEEARPDHPLGYLIEADVLWWNM